MDTVCNKKESLPQINKIGYYKNTNRHVEKIAFLQQ